MPFPHRFLLCLLLPLCARATPAEDLAQATLFAFGGIGYGGMTSQGELDFRRVLAEPAAAAQFAWVATHGQPPARFYAMVGLHQLHRAAYERLKADMLSLHCPTMAGCLGGTIDGPTVLRDIENGTILREARALHRAPSPEPPPAPRTETIWLREAQPFVGPK